MLTLLLLGLTVVIAGMAALWVLSVIWRDASIVDRFWGMGFVVLAWVYAVERGDFRVPTLVTPAIVTLWGARLSWHITRRNAGRGEDYRYVEMRHKWGRNFWWMSLFTVFLLQALLLWVVALPLAFATAEIGPVYFLGVVVFAVGLIFESVGDHQLKRFRADPANKGRVLDTGLWHYTRHPNYFGDATVWWGLGIMGMAASAPLWVIVSPAVMTVLLLQVSGVTLLEQHMVQSRSGYADYVARTSSFFPWPPSAVRLETSA